MGKRLPAAAAAVAAAAIRSYARSLRSPSFAAGKAAKTPPAPLDTPRNSAAAAAAAAAASSGRAEVRDLAAACGLQEDERVPLAEVVSDCTRRWFQDTLKEARAGDITMQVLVGQMYRSGYGVNKNEHKVSRFFGFRIERSRFFKGIWFWIIGLPAYQFVIVEYFHFWISIFSFIISPSLCYH
jgi:TPR repeat protein